jgi:hypothetical protein
MTFTTTDGREVSVGMRHDPVQYKNGKPVKNQRRHTTIWFFSKDKQGQPITIEVSAACGSSDNFSRATGRKIARERFLLKFNERRPLHNANPPAPTPTTGTVSVEAKRLYHGHGPACRGQEGGYGYVPPNTAKISIPTTSIKDQFSREDRRMIFEVLFPESQKRRKKKSKKPQRQREETQLSPVVA